MWSDGIQPTRAADADWRARETRLSRFGQFTTTIDGLELHFVHHRLTHDDAVLLTHGWLSSIVEFRATRWKSQPGSRSSEGGRTAREWVEGIYTDIVRWSEPDRGGHVAAPEVPDAYVDEVRTMFSPYRSPPSGCRPDA